MGQPIGRYYCVLGSFSYPTNSAQAISDTKHSSLHGHFCEFGGAILHLNLGGMIVVRSYPRERFDA